jgi:quercetin dioxygenase-like cupin family protein
MEYLIGSIEEVEESEVKRPRSKGTYIKWLITREQGSMKYAVRKFAIRPGGFISHHYHKYVETLVFLKGEGEVCIKGEKRGVRKGDFAFINSGVPHSLYNHSKEDLEFLCVISYEEDMKIVEKEGC